MLGVWCAFRAEGRRRWLSWLAIAGLVAIVGGTVLTGASAARRTDGAFPDYLARYGADAEVYTSSSDIPAAIVRLPFVKVSVRSRFVLNANGSANGQLVPADFLSVIVLPREATAHFVKLLSGRLPRAVDEADVGYSMQQQYHLRLGSTVTVPLYAPSQAKEVFDSSGTPTPHGPTMHFRVVGVVAGVGDFLSSQPTYSVYVPHGFSETIGPRTVEAVFGLVRLAHGAADLPRLTYDGNHVVVNGFVGTFAVDDETTATEQSINPQAVGWWLFALLALLAGLALVAQALSRQSIVERESYPSLSALGCRPGQLLAIGLARAGIIGVGGALGAVAIATALSPLTPVGEARLAEPRQGVVFDPAVFGLGAAAIVVATLALGLLPAWRAAQIQRLRQRQERSAGHGVSRVVATLARTGAGPSVLVGIRHALERGRGRNSVPVASALVGTAAAVMVLVGAAVFGASLSTLLSTPRLYGQDFQFVMSGASRATGEVDRGAASRTNPAVIERDRRVDRQVHDRGRRLCVLATIAVAAERAALVFSLVNGRDPRGEGEIALGTQTMRAAGAARGLDRHTSR